MTRRRRLLAILLTSALVLTALGTVALLLRPGAEDRSLREQACGLDPELRRIVGRGVVPGRSGEIVLVASESAYVVPADDAEGPSGPWPSYQRVPLAFYAPGTIQARGEVDAPATLADVAPTLVTLLRGAMRGDGDSLDEVVTLEDVLERPPPRLVVTVVWHGVGWNVLELWPGDQENLLAVIEGGTAFEASVGSSPTDAAPALATVATGGFPTSHGITGDVMRAFEAGLIDASDDGAGPRLPTLAGRWAAQSQGGARTAVIGGRAGAQMLASDVEEADVVMRQGDGWEVLHGRFPLRAEDDEVDLIEALIERRGFGDDDVADLIYLTAGDVERALVTTGDPGSEEVFAALEKQDRDLGRLLELLDRTTQGRYVLVLLADGGTRPVAGAVAVEASWLEAWIEDRFGPVVEKVRSTEVFLDPGAPADEVARALASLRIGDVVDVGRAEEGDAYLFDAALPSDAVGRIRC